MNEKKVFDFLYNYFMNGIQSPDAAAALQEYGYLLNSKITEKGLNYLEAHRVNNAIILAAGISSRFVPICFDKPKGLLKVNGEILIERQICQLKQTGIDEIIIVVGYKKEQFYYLKEKYNVILIENIDYQLKNNYASVYLAKDYLKNTIITSSDLYFAENLFQKYAYDSYYCSIFINGGTDERGLVIDEDDKIINTYYDCHDIWVSLGHAFFSERFSANYINIVSKIIDNPDYYNKFWADIQDEYLSDLYMYIKRCNKNDIYEFDSLRELYEFEPGFNGCQSSESLSYICTCLNCNEKELYDFTPFSMKGNLKICSFRYSNNIYYYCVLTKNIIDIDELYKIMPRHKFYFISFDNVKHRAILKIQKGEYDV
jgi:CTP:phosphocholine cytidylyltransferase-like protein